MQPDPDHWLYRLDAASWLRAAASELAAGEANVSARRAAITHARRAAGMALNAALVLHAEATGDFQAAAQRWGRSYIDHLRALAEGDEAAAAPLPPQLRGEARALLEIPVLAPATGLVQLAAAPHAAARGALEIARHFFQACAALQPSDPTDPE